MTDIRPDLAARVDELADQLAAQAELTRALSRALAREGAGFAGTNASDSLFEATFASAPLGMAVFDRAGRIQRANSALAALTGISAERLVGASLNELLVRDDLALHDEQAGRLLSGELSAVTYEPRLRTPSGEQTPVRIVLSTAGDHLVAQVEDVAETTRLQERVRFEAEHDAHTGLYNRAAFGAIVQRHLGFARRYEREGSLVVLDLDKFHRVNEERGQAVGDELLKAVSSALRERARETDVVARLGSDEFGILLPEVDAAEGLRIAGELIAAIEARSVGPDDAAVSVSASAGVSHFGASGARTTEEVLTEADLALSHAKHGGRGHATLFDASVRDRHADEQLRRRWGDKVRDAIENGSFLLDCQPIVGAEDGEPVAYELFLRMVDGDGSMVRPNFFLHLAAKFGYMTAIDEWVIARAVGMAAARAAAEAPVTLAVNVSAEAVRSPRVVQQIVDLLAAHPEAGPHLVFELSERVTVEETDHTRTFIARLGEYGCRFALEGFGSGSGSFSELKRLPFDYVKLDGEFVRGLPSNPEDQAIVSALVAVAKTLGQKTVATCVEDEQILTAARAYGLDMVQGLHVGRPGRVSEVLGLEFSTSG
jgi:diguanylate cyclase (GGDEF)-like protein/PAS domain S-box-containing protein